MTTPKQNRLFLLAAFVLMLSTAASATYITLTNTVTVESVISSDESTLNISLVNTGDEAAHDVQLSLLLPEGISSEPAVLGRVDPNSPKKAAFNLSISPDLLPGKYSLAILTEYRDANGYPFSSVTPSSLVVKKALFSSLEGFTEEVEVGTKGKSKLAFTLRNPDATAHTVDVRMFSSKELLITPESRTVSVDAKKTADLEFEVESFGALAGSSYVVFASLDYEEGGMHYSSTSRGGLVKVVEQKEDVSFSGWLPVAVIVVLIVVLIIYQFIK